MKFRMREILNVFCVFDEIVFSLLRSCAISIVPQQLMFILQYRFRYRTCLNFSIYISASYPTPAILKLAETISPLLLIEACGKY